MSDKIFVPFELNDKDHSFFSDTDPDLHYYNSLSQLTYKCNYYLESSFNEDIRNHGLSSNVFSLCHVNIRSISKNLGSFENYLNLLDHHFTFVGITETWLKDSNCDLFGLTGYNMIESHRGTQGGGGVSIYVRDHISFIERPDLNQFDNSIESIFIEVNKDQLNTTKNILIGVIYRPPNQDMDIFNEKISEMLETIRKEEKFCYLLGDCNINILNYESHRLTGDFVDLLSNYSFLPLITRPTRITASSATLIDNIFTNHIENLDHSTQGLLVTDVSDHYPIFHINNRSYIGESDIYVTKRIFSERNKQAFKIALNELDWNEIYGASETNNAFHDTLGTLLNKYFPKVRIKRKYNYRKPWPTDSLRMSIKTKNKLYYCYKRINCVKNEVKYKTYKSKLQKLLKVAEKQYYQELLMKYKNNMKKSWGIIKSIINKNKSHLYQTKFKLSDGKIVSDKTTISKHFNEFFLNVGPNLAKTIPKMDTDPKFYMGESIKKSLFLEPVTLDEIMKIVSSLKETATGYDDISAMFLKSLLNTSAIHLFTYVICHFQKVYFQIHSRLPM